MDLSVEITVLKQRDATRAARLVFRDGESGPTLRDSTDPLDAPSRRTAEYQAMLIAIDVAVAMQADSVQFRIATQRMIDELTGVEAVDDPRVEEWFDRVESALLKLDTWHVRPKYAPDPNSKDM